MKNILLCIFVMFGFAFAVCPYDLNAQDLTGVWDAQLDCPGGAIEFGIELKKESDAYTGFLINGNERIKIPIVKVDGSKVELNIEHYDSVLKFDLDKQGSLKGNWKKRRGLKEWVEMKCSANKPDPTKMDKPTKAVNFLGRWEVDFESSDDPAVAIFEASKKNPGQVLGTFLTTTGDYRFLSGKVSVDGTLHLSCFDGAHAFLFKASPNESLLRLATLTGDFWSSTSWHETWSAKLNMDAKLPDSFKQTTVTEAASSLGELSFPDLDGNATRLDDPKFAGKARIIYVFGSWCPNCHDAGKYFSELEKKYKGKGLSILGLAFELTGDFERDADQVRKYLKRQGSTYPVLIAGVNDKADATKRLTILDRVRSYPTTIFLDSKGKVHSVHTGFTGPATGEAYVELKSEFEKRIDALLTSEKK